MDYVTSFVPSQAFSLSGSGSTKPVFTIPPFSLLRKKTPHRLFQADGGLKEGNGSGEPYAHLADISCKHGAKEV